MTLYLYLKVKFRFFGLTLGTVSQGFDITFDLITRSFHFKLNGNTLQLGGKTLFDERGILLQASLG